MTSYIVVDILRKILEAEMVICDLSSRNPNVLYELGIRQAFDRPVTLIRDSKTPRIFDIQGLRDIEYDESLRIDKIKNAVELLTNTLTNNAKLGQGEVNSVIKLLGIKPASLPSIEVSEDTNILLGALGNISERLSNIEDFMRPVTLRDSRRIGGVSLHKGPIELPSITGKNNQKIRKGDKVRIADFGEAIVEKIDTEAIHIIQDDGRPVSLHWKGGMDSTFIERIE